MIGGNPFLFRLEWDTGFFGREIARLDAAEMGAPQIAQLLADAKAQGIELVYVFADPENLAVNAAIAASGAHLVDEKVDFQIPLSAAELPLAAEAELITAEGVSAGDREVLNGLALQSGEFSRFRIDPRIGTQAWARLYAQWMNNSLTGEIADAVIAIREAGRIAGFVSIKQTNADTARIGLIAVDATVRGRGIGQRLIAASRQCAAKRGCSTILVATQLRNIPACAFYVKAGFTRASIGNIYHMWID